jgi:hypothetical protein
MRWVGREAALGAGVAGVLLTGCASDDRMMGLPQASTAAPMISAGQLVGRWGAAAYRVDKDRNRTIAIAKQSCGNPMTIKQGPGNTILWFVADSPDEFEMTARVGPDGQTYIGPADKPAKSEWDRLVLSYEGNVLTWRFVDPDNDLRYGTNVMVRCGAA